MFRNVFYATGIEVQQGISNRFLEIGVINKKLQVCYLVAVVMKVNWSILETI